MEAAEFPSTGSHQAGEARPVAIGRAQSLTRRWSRAEDERRNDRTVELLRRAGDESVPRSERQQCIDLAVELNLPIAEALARRYRSRGEDLDDLIQVARLGLIQAVHRFSPEMGNFAAFAVPTITGEIKRHFRDHFWSTPRPPRRLQSLHREAVDAWSDVAQETGRIPTTAEIAGRLGAHPDEVREALTANPLNSSSLDAATETVPSAANWIGTLDPGFEAVDDELERAQLTNRLQSAIAELSEQDRLILHMRFKHNCRQSAIAAELGISQMSVSRRLTKITQVLHTKLLR